MPLEVSPFSADVLLAILKRHPAFQHAAIRVVTAPVNTELTKDPSGRQEERVLTDGGHLIIDVHFGTISQPDALHQELKSLVGIFETGLFIGMAKKVFLGFPDG